MGVRTTKDAMTEASRRFPPPWIAKETEACFIIHDCNGQALAYVYFKDEPGRRVAAKLLSRDEASALTKQWPSISPQGYRWGI